MRRLKAIVFSTAIVAICGIALLATPSGKAFAGLSALIQTDYCISGNGNGTAWTWTITTTSGDLSGAPTGVTGTAGDVRDLFVASIEAARVAAVQAVPKALPGAPTVTCPAPAARFEIVDLPTPTLSVSPTGGGAEVPVVPPDITAGVNFNPRIWIPLPEPAGTVLLISGGLALAALRRWRARR